MTGPQELTALVEGYLDELALTPELGELAGPIRYALAGGGKRIRPVLCLATGEALGREPEELLPAGAAIELVHNFSLVLRTSFLMRRSTMSSRRRFATCRKRY